MKPSRLTALSCWCRPAYSADVEGFGPLQQQRKSVSSWFCCSVTFPSCGFEINVLILWTNTHSLIMQALVALQCSVCCRLARRCLTLGWLWWTDQSQTSALRAPPSCTCLFFNEWCCRSAFIKLMCKQQLCEVCWTVLPPAWFKLNPGLCCCAAVKTHFPTLSWGWSCGAVRWRTSLRWPTRQRNWPRSSAARLEGALGKSSALCWTPQTQTPFCSTTPSQRMCASFT